MTGISTPLGLDPALGTGLVMAGAAAAGPLLPAGSALGNATATGFAKLLRGAHGPPTHGPAIAGGAELDPSGDPEDFLDSAVRHAAHLAPPMQGHGAMHAPEHSAQHAPAPPADPLAISAPAPIEVRAAASLEDLLPALVRNVAWSATGQRGVIHLELGAGSLSGTRLVIEADAGRVRVTIAAPPSTRSSVDLASWRERIAARLTARGIDVRSVELA
jgi:hypothetical protein